MQYRELKNYKINYLTRIHCNSKEIIIQLVHAQIQIFQKHVIASTTVMCCYNEAVGQKSFNDNYNLQSLY